MTLLERVQNRLAGEPGEERWNQLQELCDLAETRICLRVGESCLPPVLAPIAADVAVKLFRRWNYEGIASESGSGLSTSFVENVLSEYADELDAYVAQKAAKAGKGRVRFL